MTCELWPVFCTCQFQQVHIHVWYNFRANVFMQEQLICCLIRGLFFMKFSLLHSCLSGWQGALSLRGGGGGRDIARHPNSWFNEWLKFRHTTKYTSHFFSLLRHNFLSCIHFSLSNYVWLPTWLFCINHNLLWSLLTIQDPQWFPFITQTKQEKHE